MHTDWTSADMLKSTFTVEDTLLVYACVQSNMQHAGLTLKLNMQHNYLSDKRQRLYLWWSLTFAVTCMQGRSYRRRLRSLLLCLWDIFWELINSLVCWFWVIKGWHIIIYLCDFITVVVQVSLAVTLAEDDVTQTRVSVIIGKLGHSSSHTHYEHMLDVLERPWNVKSISQWAATSNPQTGALLQPGPLWTHARCSGTSLKCQINQSMGCHK